MIEKSFPVRPFQAPRKRFRGKRRYYRLALQKARAFSLSLSDADWFDLWHYHADWLGYGNLSWQHRKAHIEALCIVFNNIAHQVADSSLPYQLWLNFHGDAGQDAVYFHTLNPNHANFPITFSNAEWGLSELEQFLSQWLAPFPLRAGIGVWEGKRQIYVYSTAHGQPLEIDITLKN